jgi:AraC-like DNA-binding protein
VNYREWTAGRWPELACLWSHHVGAEPHVQRVVPDGCMDLIWIPASGRLELAGPDTAAFTVAMPPGSRMFGVRFRPGMAPPAIGVPADAVRDVHAPLRDLWGEEALRLADRLDAAADPAAVLRDAALHRLRTPVIRPDPAAPALAAGLSGQDPVREVAARLGFSERHLRRRTQAAFGYGPKTVQRVLRFQRALALAACGLPHADVAARLGYSDQAHLAHEVRDLGGAPLAVLTTR